MKYGPVADCTCKGCGMVFQIVARRLKLGEGQYCSRKCSNANSVRTGSDNPNWRGGKEFACARCASPFWVKPSAAKRRKYCSRECKDTALSETGAMLGPNNPQWAGGKTVEAKGIRRSGEYARWRRAVRKRDVVCVMCGSDQDLHCDHIKSFIAHPELRFDVDNGRVLCAPCHRKTPTWAKGARRAA